MMRARTVSRLFLRLRIGTILLGLSTVQVVQGREWTPDKDQVIEQPRPYSPYAEHVKETVS